MTNPKAEKLSRPDMILRVGFVGVRTIPENSKHVEEALGYLLPLLAQELFAIAHSDSGEITKKSHHPIARFYSKKTPTIRLITGLAEGADEMATGALDRINTTLVTPELAAVIPFGVEDYRSTRPTEFLSRFDRNIERCTYVLALDGNYQPGDEGKNTRARAYRAQATTLLRHSDILLAVADLNEPTRLGGTIETIKAALASSLPVLLIDVINGNSRLLEPGADISDALVEKAEVPNHTNELQSQLREVIASIVADPDSVTLTNQQVHSHKDGHVSFGERLLEEYFESDSQPRHRLPSLARSTVRKLLWEWFESQFQSSQESNVPDWKLASIEQHRSRATALNYHYGGLYHGAFILNYLLAVAAVFLAALSLILMQQPNGVSNGTSHHSIDQEQAASEEESETTMSTSLKSKVESFKKLSPSKLIVLLGLGCLKLSIVVFILRNTHRANHEGWNDKAIDYRYLGERLRSMHYLPITGSFQPPTIGRPQYASRVVRQSAVDWLFRALSRAVSPMELASRTAIAIANGKQLSISLMRIDSREVLKRVLDGWITGQFRYHNRIALTNAKMHRATEQWSRWLTLTVIGAVTLDISILTAEYFSLLPHAWESFFSSATVCLVFLAAILPAAVASLNGVRFQTECKRLADRSSVVRSMLGGHSGSSEPGGWMLEAMKLHQRITKSESESVANPGSWNVEVMLLCEQIASDLAQEVAEWSVLYAKEVPEP
jgi:hypothetical protein